MSKEHGSALKKNQSKKSQQFEDNAVLIYSY